MGDNAEVGSADIYLKRLVLGLSVAVVVLLAGMALYSLFTQVNNDEPAAEAEEIAIDDDPNSPAVTNQTERVQIGDLEFPLSIACVIDRPNLLERQTSTGADEVHLVEIHNQGQIEADYLVTARLTTDEGTSVDALARVSALRPGEVREVVLLADADVSDVRSCAITGIQSERRVLLSNG